MTRIVAFASQKGGVGKTTTTINVAAYLSRAKRKVLVIDLDPQSNLTSGVGITPAVDQRGIYDVLLGSAKLDDVSVTNDAGFDVVPANRNLSGAQVELLDIKRREYQLKEALQRVRKEYNWILLDCPPSLSIMVINALTAADSVIIPTQCEYFAMQGLVELFDTVRKVRRNFNPGLKYEGILRTMYDKRNRLSKEVSDQLNEYLGNRLFHTIIPRNVRLAEAPSHGKTIYDYDRNCIGSIAYMAFVGELLNQETNA